MPEESLKVFSVDDSFLLDIISKSHDDAKHNGKLQETLIKDDFLSLLDISKKNLFSKKDYVENIIVSIDDILRPLDTEIQIREILGVEQDYIKYSSLFTKVLSSGHSCLFGYGFHNQKKFDKFKLNDLGMKAYVKCINLLEILSDDSELNQILNSLNGAFSSLDNYVSRCAQRFDDYTVVLGYLAKNFRDLSVSGEKKIKEDVKAITVFEPKKVPSKIQKEEMTREEMDLDCYSDRRKVLSEMEQQIYLNLIDFDDLKKSLKEKVVGQDEAVESLVDSFIMQFTGFTSKKKPRNFLAVGPTGVGKNYLFEVIADEIQRKYNISFSYREVDCAVLGEYGGINALRGSDKGYVDSGKEGILTAYYFDKVRDSPFSILLFDEFEKAHNKINEFLLPLLDKGVICDSMDRSLDYGSTIIAFTSNLGYSDIRGKGSKSIGFGSSEQSEQEVRRESVEEKISRHYSPEFLNRVNIVHFGYLTREGISKIYDLEMRKVEDNYMNRFGLELIADDSIKEHIIQKGYSMEFGARFLSKHIDTLINRPISVITQKDVRYDNNNLKKALSYIKELREEQIEYDTSDEKDIKNKGLSEIDIVSAKREILHLTYADLPYRKIYLSMEDGKIIFEKSKF